MRAQQFEGEERRARRYYCNLCGIRLRSKPRRGVCKVCHERRGYGKRAFTSAIPFRKELRL